MTASHDHVLVPGGLGHSHVFFVHTDSGVHRLAPECKVVATVLFVLAVVATPREAFWAFGIHAVIVVAVAIVGRLPLRRLARRIRVEVPFLAFAAFMPIVGSAPRVTVGFLSLSVPGIWGGWNLLAKGTLGVAAAAVLTATTTVPELLHALRRLRLPSTLVGIATFMVRYGEVLRADLTRMRTARLSRGDDPRWFWQLRGIAATAGTLFVRAYERGERVYVAMLARGYLGTLHDDPSQGRPATARGWLRSLAAPLLAAAVAGTAIAAGS